VSFPSTDRDLADLLVRLAQADGLGAAARLLLDEALSAFGATRGAVMLEARSSLEVVHVAGRAGDGFRDLSVTPYGPSPMAQVYRSGCHAVARRGDMGAEPVLDALGDDCVAVLPLTRNTVVYAPFGLLLVGAPTFGDARLADVADRVLRAGPVLGRIFELDRLRREVDHLAHFREMLTSIVDSIPDPVLVTDSLDRILMENHRARTLLTASESDGEERRRAVEINHLQFSSFLARSRAASEETVGRELNLVDPGEGGDLLFEVISSPLPDAVYPGAATVSILREVTDLKRATTELERQFNRVRLAERKSRRERDRLNLILETVGDPILVTDEQARIVLMNREAERLFEGQRVGKPDDRRMRDVRANDAKFAAFITDLALSPDTSRATELQLADPESGAEFPAEVVSGKIFNDRAETTAIVSIIHDLTKAVENERLASELAQLNEGLEGRVRSATTELEERNRQLEWQQQELERAYRLKSEFLASMSHELRTPINALLGYTSLMRDQIYGDLTERQDEALQRMYAASQHLLELVNDVLDLAKIEAGKMPVHIERVDVGLLVREISMTIEPMVRRKKLEYVVDVEAPLQPIDTDRTKVKQILLNLLSNAVKFTQAGRVGLRIRRSGEDGVEIAVSDTGIGIRPEDMDTIFDDFRQVDQSSTREYGGTGLGLSITRKLLNLLGGTIRVESAVGAGSTFTVWLPLRSHEMTRDEHLARAALHKDQTVVDGGGSDQTHGQEKMP